jgi:hypothetical protein
MNELRANISEQTLQFNEVNRNEIAGNRFPELMSYLKDF